MPMAKLALHWQIAIGMVAGAAIGVALNALAGTATTSLVKDLPAELTSVTITDSVGRTAIETVDQAGRGERIEVGPAADGAAIRFDSVATLRAAKPELAALLGIAEQDPSGLATCF